MDIDIEPLVSVIIPTFNRRNQVIDAIVSVHAQTYQKFEILVVDDASSDGTTDMLSDMGLPKLRIIRRDRQGGAAAARNSGILEAAGRLLAFLDSDDVWGQQKLQRQVAYLRDNPDAGMCTTDFWLVRHNTSRSLRRSPTPLVRLVDLTFGCGLSPGSTLVARNSVFADVGLFDKSLHRLEDWDWLLTALQTHRLENIGEPLATIRFDSQPLASEVEPALRALRQRHGATIRELGLKHLLKFRSALRHESAVARFRQGDYVRAGLEFGLSLALYPIRSPRFFRRVLRGGWTHLSRRGTSP